MVCILDRANLKCDNLTLAQISNSSRCSCFLSFLLLDAVEIVVCILDRANLKCDNLTLAQISNSSRCSCFLSFLLLELFVLKALENFKSSLVAV